METTVILKIRNQEVGKTVSVDWTCVKMYDGKS